MSLEDLRNVDASKIPIGKYIVMISRGHTYYLNHKLEELNINASQLHYLFEISRESEINQERIASRCNIDKGAVARSIKKLETQGLIIRRTDEENRRQNKISLTSEGENAIESINKILNDWEEEVFDNEIIDKELLQNALKEIAINTIALNKKL